MKATKLNKLKKLVEKTRKALDILAEEIFNISEDAPKPKKEARKKAKK